MRQRYEAELMMVNMAFSEGQFIIRGGGRKDRMTPPLVLDIIAVNMGLELTAEQKEALGDAYLKMRDAMDTIHRTFAEIDAAEEQSTTKRITIGG